MAHVDRIRMSEIIAKLKKGSGTSSNYLSDQKVAQYGSSRTDDVVKSIGDDGRTFEELFIEDVKSL